MRTAASSRPPGLSRRSRTMPCGFFSTAFGKRFLHTFGSEAAELAERDILDLAVGKRLGRNDGDLDARARDGDIERLLILALDRQGHLRAALAPDQGDGVVEVEHGDVAPSTLMTTSPPRSRPSAPAGRHRGVRSGRRRRQPVPTPAPMPSNWPSMPVLKDSACCGSRNAVCLSPSEEMMPRMAAYVTSSPSGKLP